MRDLGYIEGRNYLLEERYAAGQIDNFTASARELVELPVDVIVAGGEAAIQARDEPDTDCHDTRC
jgi:putative tryptophan/tyrosine transport system substrate-binding protein